MKPVAVFLSDPKLWVSILALLASAWSGFNAWQSRRLARRALAISESQEQRRRPQLGIYMADGYRRISPGKQFLGFLVSISNPTDINNSVAQAELKITYLLDGNIKAACRIPHMPQLSAPASDETEPTANVFSLPLRIDAHQTAAGWFLFAIEDKVIGGKTIDSHSIILGDSHGVSSETEAILIREWVSEIPKG